MHRTTQLSGTGKVTEKGLDLLMLTSDGQQEFYVTLLHGEVGHLQKWLHREAPGPFHLADPAMKQGWLEKLEDGEIGYFKAKGEAFATAEADEVERLIMEGLIRVPEDGMMARMGQQDPDYI